MVATVRKTSAIVSLLLLFVACQRAAEKKTEAPKKNPRETLVGMKEDLRRADIDKIVTPVPPFVESCSIGTQPGADGTVTGQETHFTVGKPFYLTMRFHESPAGLQSSIRLYDAKKKLVVEETRPMNGAKVATFSIAPKLVKPGFYRIEGYWGGNIACEHNLTLVK
jgi:hypothetical protein